MAEVRVRLPLGTLGSLRGVGKRQSTCFGSRRPPVRSRPPRLDPRPLAGQYRGGVSWFTCLAVNEEPAGSIPAPGARFDVPNPRKGKPTGDGVRLENGTAYALGVRLPPLPPSHHWPIG